LVKFIGIECARDALADVLNKQLKDDKSLCAACSHAHEVLAKSILRAGRRKHYAVYLRRVERDLKRFKRYWDSL
jgi:hypothetical protein